MSIVIQIASWAATAYLAYSFYQTGTYVYSLWSPPSCDPSSDECFCNSYTSDTSIHFEVYLSKKKKLQQNFQSNNQFKKVFSSALQPIPSNDGYSDALPSPPVKLSFDSKAIARKTYINGRDKLYKLHKNKSQIYAHIISYIPPKSDSNYYYTSSIATDSIFSFLTVPVTYLAAPPPNTFNLKDMTSGKEKNIQTDIENVKLYDKVQYFQPNLTIFYVVDFNCYPLRGIPSDVFPYLRSQRISKAKQKTTYDPIIFSSNLFQMHKYALPMMDASGDLLTDTNHTEFQYSLKNLTLEINIEPVSLGLFRLYLMMDNSNKQMQQQWGFTEHDSDQIKGLFVDTPPILTFATFAAAMLHSIFGVLAMKSDVSFWYTKDGAHSLKGLSTNSVIFQCISSFVITVYLIDSDQTNKIVIAFMCAECILGLWKVKRIWDIKAKIEFKESIEDYVISESESDSSSDADADSDSDDESAKKRKRKKAMNKKKRKQIAKKKKQKEIAKRKKEKKKENVESLETESLDSRATRWMLMVMIPIVIGYGIYAFFYLKHKSILSFIINVSASCVYGLGFIHLTPQLFINYELQSVDSLPWRVLIYRFFNTFVDDLFSFVIDMPLMHRLACFRDDIVFFIFLFQWYKYGSKKRKTD